MCGIAGIFEGTRSTQKEDLTESVRRMSEKLIHRGPDDSGMWIDEKNGIALAHRRLSIIDLSPAGHQPMISHCGRYIIVFNGEIYNFLELRRELEHEQPEGVAWCGHSDTEVFLTGISQWGVKKALQKSVGMFAFALWDNKTKTLTLARDRMGEKPLYYGYAGNTLIFASELKALRAYPKFSAEIERNVIPLYLRHNYIPAPYSIYKGMYKLLPGCFVTIQNGKELSPFPASTDVPHTSRLRWIGHDVPHTSRLRCVCPDEYRRRSNETFDVPGRDSWICRPIPYWSFDNITQKGREEPFSGTEEEAAEILENLLSEAVKGQMIADVPLGVFLSGGIDSSTVTALMQAHSNRPVKTFSIGFYEKKYNEAEYAKAVAKHLGTEHTEFYVTEKEAMSVIPLLPTLYDEPFSDSSQIPTYLLSKLTRNHVSVSLSGDGGDELFCGYSRYFSGCRLWKMVGWMPSFLRTGISRTLSILPEVFFDIAFFWVWPLLRKYGDTESKVGYNLYRVAEVIGVNDSIEFYQASRSHWKKPLLVLAKGDQVLKELPYMFTQKNKFYGKLLNSSILRQMMMLDTLTYLPDDILVKVDRAAMAVSLESRIPLLDHRVIEFAASLPLTMNYQNGMGKQILRRVLYRYVPKQLAERPKMGFGIPLEHWLRGQLREWAEALLDKSRMKREGYFHPEPIRQKWQEHLSGKRNWHYELWDVLMFQAWLEHNRA